MYNLLVIHEFVYWLHMCLSVQTSVLLTQWAVNDISAGPSSQWVSQQTPQRIKWAVSQGDGVESVVTWSARIIRLVHRVPAPVCDQEWRGPGMVSWHHLQEVSSKSLSLSVICSRGGRRWGMWWAVFWKFVHNEDISVVSQHAVIVFKWRMKLLQKSHLCLDACSWLCLVYRINVRLKRVMWKCKTVFMQLLFTIANWLKYTEKKA